MGYVLVRVKLNVPGVHIGHAIITGLDNVSIERAASVRSPNGYLAEAHIIEHRSYIGDFSLEELCGSYTHS